MCTRERERDSGVASNVGINEIVRANGDDNENASLTIVRSGSVGVAMTPVLLAISGLIGLAAAANAAVVQFSYHWIFVTLCE